MKILLVCAGGMSTGLPCDTIPSFDYAIANCPNIMKLAQKLYAQL